MNQAIKDRSMTIDIDQFDLTTKEGKWLNAALVCLSTDAYPDMTSYEILGYVAELSKEMELMKKEVN